MASVGGFFKAVGKVAFPFLSMAAQAGGPWTAMAAQQVGKALGIDGGVEATPDAIEKAMSVATMTPDQRLALQKCEQDFQIQVQQLTNDRIKTAQDFELHLEEVAAKDRDSARNREIQVKDKTPAIGFYLITAMFGAMVFLLYKYTPPVQNEKLLYLLLGAVVVAWPQTIAYFYGTNAGSARKTELLAQAPSIASGKEDAQA